MKLFSKFTAQLQYAPKQFCQIIFYVGCVSGILLLPYGDEAGDTNVTSGDDVSVILATQSIKIGDKFYNRFTVSIFVYTRLIMKERFRKVYVIVFVLLTSFDI